MRADESAESSIEANRFRAETGSLEDGGGERSELGKLTGSEMRPLTIAREAALQRVACQRRELNPCLLERLQMPSTAQGMHSSA